MPIVEINEKSRDMLWLVADYEHEVRHLHRYLILEITIRRGLDLGRLNGCRIPQVLRFTCMD